MELTKEQQHEAKSWYFNEIFKKHILEQIKEQDFMDYVSDVALMSNDYPGTMAKIQFTTEYMTELRTIYELWAKSNLKEKE